MTVAVSCNLSDGVVLGVDSAVSMPGPRGLSTFENAEKLFSLGNTAIGVAIYGNAAIGARSVGSYLREFESTEGKATLSGKYKLENVVEKIREYFSGLYSEIIIPSSENLFKKDFEAIPEENKPIFGFVIGGYSAEEYLPEIWTIELPFHAKKNSAIQSRAKGSFGTNWFATCKPIQRYIKGFDYDLYPELRKFMEDLKGEPLSTEEQANFEELIQKFEYVIPFQAMPIKEGIEHTRFLIDLVIKHYKYALDAPIVGGNIQLGVVSYHKKSFEIFET